ncbi:MAG: Ig-like domain-containing protein, partial [Plesiomonas sp.]
TALQITPAIDSVPVGLTKSFTAIATLSDGRTLDVTNDPAISWNSTPSTVATISSNQPEDNGITTGVAPGTATITASLAANRTFLSATAQLTVTNAIVTALQVTPTTESVPAGLTKPFTAIATLSDGSTQDVTNDPAISWNSTPSTVATISSNQPEHNGIITGVAPGTATITASLAANRTFLSATAQLTVTNAIVTALQVTPTTESVPAGLTKPFTAIATLSDGRTLDVTNDPTISWNSTPSSIATISSNQPEHNGIITGVAPGTAMITASVTANRTFFSATAQLTVTNAVVTALQVTPVTESVPVGLAKPFTAIATLSDGRTQDLTNDPALSWSSSPLSVATISSNQLSNNGIATGVTTGTATITAAAYVDGTLFNATAQLEVTQAVVTALQVTPATESVPIGLTKAFTAIATLSDGSTQDVTNDPSLNWSSDALGIATISSNQPNNNGIVTGVNTGIATITASGTVNRVLISATAQLTVSNAIITALEVSPATEFVPVGLSKAFTAIATFSNGSRRDVTNDPALSWSSDAPGIATISSSQPDNNGLATGVSTGIATITASGTVNRAFFSATAQLTVIDAVVTDLEITPATESVPVGLTRRFIAIAIFSDGRMQDITDDPAISWSSTPSSVATISSNQPENNG